MDTLTTVEAERIVAVLEDAVEKLSFLDCITPDILQHRDELSKFIGDEISKTMTEQRRLEHRYEELIEQRATMKGMINKSKYKEVQEEIQDVSRALRESTNNLVRSLKENPNVSGNLIKVERDRTELHDLALRCVQELRDRGMYHTITFRVDEENNAKVRFQQLRAREKELRETVFKLQEQLTDEQKSFNRTSTEQRQAITQLKDELQLLKSSTSTDAKFKRKESGATVSAIWREFKHKERILESRLKDLEDKLQTEQLVNSETKAFLIRKHNSLSEDISKWDAKYDRDVGEMDSDIRNISSERSALLEKLYALQARKQVETEQEASKKSALIQEKEVAEFRKEIAKKQNKAARVIQRELRAFIKRKKELDALKNDGKKKKGGAAGGKKGKKK